MFGFIFGERPLWNRPDLSHIDFYAPALMAAYVSQAGLISLPVFLANYRQVGILKRYVVSPISIGTYLSVHTAVQFVIFLISSAILIVTAEGVFDIQFRGHWAVVLCVGTACISCFFTLGFFISGLSKSPRSIQALGQFLFFIMFFISGAAFPKQIFPDWLQILSRASPLTHVVEAFSGVWLGDPLSQYTNSLLFLAGITALSCVISIRIFKWEV